MTLSETKKQQIIKAAVQAFKEKGFTGTSMDHIAERAHVSKRTVYNHFESKDALFFGIVEYMFSLIAATRPPPYDSGQSISGQLRDIATAKIRLFSSDDFLDLSRVTLPEAILHPEKMQQAMQHFSEIENSMEQWFDQAIQDQQINADSAHLACEQFMGLIKMDAYWPRIFTGKTLTEANILSTAQKTTNMFLAYFKAS